MKTKVGSLTEPGATGSQAITGVGFQPKAIIFWWTSKTADGSDGTGGNVAGYGLAVSSSQRVALGIFGSNNNGTPNAGTKNRQDPAKCITVLDGAGAVVASADLTSMDSDGFTINWAARDSTRIINYMALGGSDLTNAAIVANTSPTSTGNQAYTGVGFQPDCIITLASCHTAATAATFSNNTVGIGFGKSSSNRAAYGTDVVNNANPSDSSRIQLTTKVIALPKASSGTLLAADIVSMDTDGFTLNWSTVDASARGFFTLCLKGGKYFIGSETQKTTTGTKATTGVGFEPVGMLVGSFDNATSGSVQAAARHSFGAASGSTARAATWWGDKDNATDTDFCVNLDRANLIKMHQAVLGSDSVTLDAAADLTSFDLDGFTLNWGTADATAREFIYLAFGSGATGGLYPWMFR